ncbi:exocyst complex component Sec10 [Patellaria atrata CBS 101060]|uniref:Exocyst complex component Sec10 n=1 Tax=Patellaria atrata CBS 101060 TaxID=1346257 RepID=A0A9P4VPA5_9PEZI|nr:exocyst complex component Sec10 [Patellaria atrata CBS 101060]
MPTSSGDTASILSSVGTISRGKGHNFTLETFSSKDFIVKDFIEALSDSAIPASRRSAPITHQAAFDPKPLIRTFEHALSRLGSLSEELESQENELSGAVRRAEAQHNANVSELSKKLERAIESFHQLDSSLNGSSSERDGDIGGNTAVRIGEQLDELDGQRQRAQDAKFLIQCWIEVSEKGNLASLEDVRRLGTSEGKIRCAHIARQLLKISVRMETGSQVNGKLSTDGADRRKTAVPTKHSTREIIEKFLEGLETDLLKQFDDSYRKQHFENMRECAIALRDFSDGASMMALFVNQHPFFIDRSQLITEEVAGNDETWDQLADPDTEPPGVEPSLQSLVDEVKITVQNEAFIIKNAFPFYDEVLSRFLQRIFQQSIQQRLEMVLEKANSISSLAFLRTLQASRSYIGTLVDDLKAHGLTQTPEPVSSQIAATLDQQLEDLFVPYFVGSSYIEREKKNLEELYSSLLLKFTIYHSKRRKVPTTYLGSLGQRGRELISSARDAYMDKLDSSDLPASQKAMLLRIAGLKDADSEKTKGEIEVTEKDGALSLPNAKRMLKWLAEGVGRSLELSGGNETPKDVQALLSLLLSHMGEIYLETALDAAAEQAAAAENTKTEPDLNYLPSLRSAITIIHLLQTATQTVLFPLASPNLTIRREIEKTTQTHLSIFEHKISTILQRTLDAALAWTGKLLAGQKKQDFRPKDDAALALGTETPTCLAVFTFLSHVATAVAGSLDGRNRQLFCEELATGLRSLLLEHFRKFTVSLTGGLVISKDVTKYAELVRGWPVGEHFAADQGGMQVLVDVGTLFVIGPEALRERLRNSNERNELRSYVLKREDVGSVGVQSILSSL